MIRRTRNAGLTALGIALLLAAWSAQLRADDGAAKANLINGAGQSVGVVQFLQQGEVVLVKVEVSGLSGGFHGFHVHKYGSCDPDPLTSAHPDTGKKGVFLSAGGHFNPTGETHKDHAGDMPLLLAMQEGVASARFKTDRLDVSALVDPPRAVIVHADPDNYANIPARYGGPDVATLATGDAGARYACGVIAESE